MIDRKLLVDALRIDNADVLPKFGSSDVRRMMENEMEFLGIDTIVDYEEGTVTENGIYSIMDALNRGSVGIEDSDGTPALSFILKGNEIIAHNLFTDEDSIIDATSEALAEYIIDSLESDVNEENEKTAVAFKYEYKDYLDKHDVIAVFIDEMEIVDGDVARQLVYRLSDHEESYEDPSAMEKLPDATVHQYEPLKQELEEKGYNLEIWNEPQEPAMHEDVAEANNVIEDVLEMCKDLVPSLREKAMAVLAGKISGKEALHEFLMDLRDAVVGKITESLYNRLDDAIDNLYKEMNGEELDEVSPLEVPAGFAMDEAQQNYAIVIAKDVGNDYEIIEIKEGYSSFDEAQAVLNDMETDSEFYDDPTMMLFVAYSDGTSWFNATTGDELIIESVEESENGLKYFTYTKDSLKTKEDFDRAEDEMKKALAEEPNMDAKKVIQKDMEIVKSWQNQLESINEDSYEGSAYEFEIKCTAKGTCFGYDADSVLEDLKGIQNYVDLNNAKAIKLDANRRTAYITELALDTSDVKVEKHTKESTNEDSEASKTAEDLLNYVEEAMSNAKDNIIKRLKYRFEDNVSYFGSEAEEKAEEVKTQVKNALINLADAIYEVIG